MSPMFLVVIILQHLVNADWNVEYIHKKYVLQWNIWEEAHCSQFGLDSCVEISLEVQTNGWISFGLSKSGQMTESDMVIGWIDNNNKPHLQRRYTTTLRTTPIFVEDITHTITSFEKINNTTKINFVRELFPCQSHEYIRQFEIGTTRVIYAWSDIIPNCQELKECKLSFHGINRGKQFINFHTKQQDVEMPTDTKYFDLINTNYEIPAIDTMYYCGYQKINVPNMDKLHHIIRIDPVITPGNERYVHHVIVQKCTVSDPKHFGKTGDCRRFYRDPKGIVCHDSIMEWAIGRRAFYLPKHIGLELGGIASDTLEYVKITWHYNNPWETAGIMDNSGLRFYYTNTLRQHTGMIMNIQNPSNHLFLPGGISTSIVYGHCSSYCTDAIYPKNGINIISIAFHMHLTGVAGKLRHIRNGTELKPVDENKAYNTSFQEFVLLKEEINVLPGDDLILECHYNTSNRVGVTVGGRSAIDEMCITWMIVYPKNNLSSCSATPTKRAWNQFLHNATTNGYWNGNIRSKWKGTYYNTSNDKAVQLYKEFLNQSNRVAHCSNFPKRKEFVIPESKDGFVAYDEKNLSAHCGTVEYNTKANFMMTVNKLQFGNGIYNIVVIIGIIAIIIATAKCVNRKNKKPKPAIRLKYDHMNDTECEILLPSIDDNV